MLLVTKPKEVDFAKNIIALNCLLTFLKLALHMDLRYGSHIHKYL